MSEKGRSKRIGVRLTDDLANRLDEWAERIGIAPSTLAAQAIGEYINKKQTERDVMFHSAKLSAITMSKEMAKQFSNPEVIRNMAQAGYDIDEDEVKKLSEEVNS